MEGPVRKLSGAELIEYRLEISRRKCGNGQCVGVDLRNKISQRLLNFYWYFVVYPHSFVLRSFFKSETSCFYNPFKFCSISYRYYLQIQYFAIILIIFSLNTVSNEILFLIKFAFKGRYWPVWWSLL